MHQTGAKKIIFNLFPFSNTKSALQRIETRTNRSYPEHNFSFSWGVLKNGKASA